MDVKTADLVLKLINLKIKLILIQMGQIAESLLHQQQGNKSQEAGISKKGTAPV